MKTNEIRVEPIFSRVSTFLPYDSLREHSSEMRFTGGLKTSEVDSAVAFA